MKEINISAKLYKINCNAYTYIIYPKLFGNSIFEDISVIQQFVGSGALTLEKLKNDNNNLSDDEIAEMITKSFSAEKLQAYIESSLKLAYALIYTANNDFMEYNEWLKTIRNIDAGDEWIAEIANYVITNFIDFEAEEEVKKK